MLSIPICKTQYQISIHGKISSYIKELTKIIISITLEHEKIKNNNRIEVKYCSIKEMESYNLEFNKTATACDVFSLTFNQPNSFEKNLLGIIFICPQIIKQDVELQNSIKPKFYQQHLTHLIIHSTLHVLNYDHTTELQKQSMEAKEITILSKFQIKNPYL